MKGTSKFFSITVGWIPHGEGNRSPAPPNGSFVPVLVEESSKRAGVVRVQDHGRPEFPSALDPDHDIRKEGGGRARTVRTRTSRCHFMGPPFDEINVIRQL